MGNPFVLRAFLRNFAVENQIEDTTTFNNYYQ